MNLLRKCEEATGKHISLSGNRKMIFCWFSLRDTDAWNYNPSSTTAKTLTFQQYWTVLQMSTTTVTTLKSGRLSSKNDNNSTKKTSSFIAIRCNSFKVVGALLICAGVMNFYLSSIWVSAVVVLAGMRDVLPLVVFQFLHIILHINDDYELFVRFNAICELSFSSPTPSNALIVLRFIDITCSSLWLSTYESRWGWYSLDCAPSAARREHCKRWSLSLRVDTGSCHTSVSKRSNDDRCCRLGLF